MRVSHGTLFVWSNVVLYMFFLEIRLNIACLCITTSIHRFIAFLLWSKLSIKYILINYVRYVKVYVWNYRFMIQTQFFKICDKTCLHFTLANKIRMFSLNSSYFLSFSGKSKMCICCPNEIMYEQNTGRFHQSRHVWRKHIIHCFCSNELIIDFV